ncbi:Hydroxycinnamoyl-Coenzyme A shikimate/quinate hydroxycinnamoyltransferase-like protein [Heracleum sosnowskyi]|uniref:Hydroxycinnamoyl-Coenzyme A shikimate/quinate hydroxycinnamoyltransferase-like protein n=1 Tax=Heracleum sosnowskyi TaxID=360622 RepID=A0AAD8J1K3_9APIA|nr:Hydroxycinnamoyl-Coenzyme A shikimate/quinate hydroxycinnamoyltransferase-like protein [Heracleum sosnowskyi]
MEDLVYNKKISTVVPARMTPEEKSIHELSNMDLAMKLHYIRGVYLFESKAVEGLVILDIKRAFFLLLNVYFPASGRVRMSEKGGGRPTIRCNDSGVRIVEAQSSKKMEEWMDMIKDDHSLNDHLVYKHVLGPDLGFSPLVYVQFTWFQCGGMSVGLSWSHILGDVFTASAFINTWAQILGGQLPRQPAENPSSEIYQLPSFPTKSCSLKRVGPVGDYWVAPSNCKMRTHSFHITGQQLHHLLIRICGLSPRKNIRPFEYVSAIIWKSLAKIRKEVMSESVTICTNNFHGDGNELPRNRQVVSTVAFDASIVDANVVQLAELIAKKQADEREMIEELIDKEDGNLDCIVYGANLTFVDLEDLKMYEMELKGVKTVYADYTIDGVGDNGVILVLPEIRDGDQGIRVTMVLSENEVEEIKHELKYEWGIN